jgi:hypothetical protein
MNKLLDKPSHGVANDHLREIGEETTELPFCGRTYIPVFDLSRVQTARRDRRAVCLVGLGVMD